MYLTLSDVFRLTGRFSCLSLPCYNFDTGFFRAKNTSPPNHFLSPRGFYWRKYGKQFYQSGHTHHSLWSKSPPECRNNPWHEKKARFFPLRHGKLRQLFFYLFGSISVITYLKTFPQEKKWLVISFFIFFLPPTSQNHPCWDRLMSMPS